MSVLVDDKMQHNMMWETNAMYAYIRTCIFFLQIMDIYLPCFRYLHLVYLVHINQHTVNDQLSPRDVGVYSKVAGYLELGVH